MSNASTSDSLLEKCAAGQSSKANPIARGGVRRNRAAVRRHKLRWECIGAKHSVELAAGGGGESRSTVPRL